MSDFSVRSDNVDVEQIMRQIRARIREKRGVDYTEDEIRELASVKLEKFLDPKGVRSDLLEQFRRIRDTSETPWNYSFEDTTLFASRWPLLRFLRRLLNPILKLFFNPNPLIEALHIQSRLNETYALSYELMHNLVVELTRTSIEVKNLKMRLESMSSRLDFDERRARALEGVVQYRPGTVAPLQPPTGQPAGQPGQHNELDNDGNERRSRRRRRRGRRRSATAFAAGDAASRFGDVAAAPSEESTERGGEPSEAAGDESAYASDESARRFGETSADRITSASYGGRADATLDDAGHVGRRQSETDHEPVTPKPPSGEGGPVAPKPQNVEGGPVAPKPQNVEGGSVAPKPQSGEGGPVAPKPQSGEGG
jgi:hypothetical protein